MKKLFTILTIVLLSIISYSQAPQKLSYQAVIRNSSGQLVTNHAVGIKATILQGSPSGTVVYQETFNSLTNGNGLVSIEIGGGTLVSGNFSTINWASGSYYLRTETDPSGGTSYTISGTSQLISVPYALHAKNAASYTETDPVFVAAPAKAITSGLITNWNTAYGWGNHAGLYRPVSYVPAWSEITSKPTSISGYGITDAVTLTGNQTISGIKTFNNDLIVNSLTVGMGHESGLTFNTALGTLALNKNNGGTENTAIGHSSLGLNTSGYYNTAVGSHTLSQNIGGNSNTAVGWDALLKNNAGSGNTAIGSSALANNMGGECNIAVGTSLFKNTSGNFNTAIGYGAISNNQTGSNNTAIGIFAGSSSLASRNVFIGSYAGFFETGANKLYIDNQQRANESYGRVKALIYGVFDASPANQYLTINGNTNINGNLQIGKSAGPITSNWWKYGTDSNSGTGIDFHSNASPTDYSARIHRTPGNDGEFQIVNAGAGPLVLYTSGGLGIVGLPSSSAGSMLLLSNNRVYAFSSSIRTKENIIPLSDNFSKILDAQPVSFTDKATGVRSIGYIAEEFEKDGLQNLLVYENGKLVSLRYDLISVYNLEVIKELKKHIESMDKENETLRSELADLRTDLDNLKRKLKFREPKSSRK